MSTREILDKIFKKPVQSFGLDEFSAIRSEDVLDVFEKEKGKFYLKCLKRNKDLLVWNEERQAGEPEEIIRQLWIHKLINEYNYPLNRIDVEVSVDFGHEVHEKAADIVVYQEDKQTAWIILEVKSPEAKDGLEQIKSYLNAKGGPLGILSDGRAKIILYRPYPHQFENTLRDIPKADQTIQDVLEETLTIDDLEPNYDLVKIIKILEELVLAGAGVDSFNEIFKLIYAKLYDEKYAKDRKGELLFRQSSNPQITFDNISRLFEDAKKEWPGMFLAGETIQLSPTHLSVCIGEIEKVKLLLHCVPADSDDVIRDYEVVRNELGKYNPP